MTPELLERFLAAATQFAADFSSASHQPLRGVTDGKAVGTYIEHRFRDFLETQGIIETNDFGSSARGIDLPSLNTDIKVTSIRQPQSSSPFSSFRQKIEGLGYHILLFVYEKTDTITDCFLPLRAVRFLPRERTADYQTTRGILDILERKGNADDIFAFLVERMIPADEITLAAYAQTLCANPPLQGYLTISNALQWRLQYQRIVHESLDGVIACDPIQSEAIIQHIASLDSATDPIHIQGDSE